MNNYYQSSFLADDDAYANAMAMPLDRKIDKAIALLKSYNDIKGELYIANSGGKDSGVIMKLAKLAKIDFRSFYSNVTIDPPELIYHIKKVYPSTTWINPKMHIWHKLLQKSYYPPTRTSRWCCLEYKENSLSCPCKIIGVRASESRRRAKMWKQVIANKHDSQQVILAPILYWTDSDVWSFHQQENIPYCDLYNKGFSRLGCIGCPLSDSNHRQKQFAMYPRYQQGWENAICKCWNMWVNVPLDKPRFIKAYDGVGQLIKPDYSNGDTDCTKIINGAPVSGFITKQRFFKGFASGLHFYNWWATDSTPVDDECQYASLLV